MEDELFPMFLGETLIHDTFLKMVGSMMLNRDTADQPNFFTPCAGGVKV
jgi:hypothetical protein